MPRARKAPPLPPTAGVPVLLDYRDVLRHATVRVVMVRSVTTSSDLPGATLLYLQGYCLLRRAKRTFRGDRIVSAADPVTGELITDLQDYVATHPAMLPPNPVGTSRPEPPPRPAPPRPTWADGPRPTNNPLGLGQLRSSAAPRPPPPSGVRAALMVLAGGAGILAIILLIGSARINRAPAPQPSASVARPAPPPLDEAGAFWLGLRLGCDPAASSDAVATQVSDYLDRLQPPEVQTLLIAAFARGRAAAESDRYARHCIAAADHTDFADAWLRSLAP